MAKLSSAFITCLSEINCVITGLQCVDQDETKSSGFKITTKKSVVNLQESESKPLNIWTCKPSQHFSCAAIHDASTNQYAACINDKASLRNFPRCWSFGMTQVSDITKVKPSPTAATIQRLFTSGAGGIVVLYSDGAVCSTKMEQLSDAVTEAKGGLLQAGEVTMESHLWSIDEKEAYVVCLVEKSKQYSLHFKQVPEVNQVAEQITKVSLDLPAKCSLHHASFHTTSNQFVLHAVGSDGHIYQFSLSHSELPLCKTLSSQAVVMGLFSSKQAKQVRVAGISPLLIAAVGLDRDYADHVCIFDTKFSILQAKQPLKTSTDKTKTSVSNIVYASNYLWVSTNHGITGFRVERAPSTLSMALGRQSMSEEINRVPVLGQQWGFDKQGNVEEQMDTSDGTEPDLVQDILDKGKCKTAKQFKTAVSKLLSSQQMAVPHVEKATILQRILKRVCERCQEEKKFWSKEGLIQIIKTGLIAASSCPDFIECVIEKGDIHVLSSCLQHMQDIPDKTLASIIGYALRDLSSESGDIGRTEPPTQCPIAEDTAHLINLILRCPMNDVFMLECIANVTFQQIMVLLRYLYFRLNTTIVDDEQSLPANVVVDWIMLILDAHYSQLVLSSEARLLLVGLHQIVETLSRYHDDADAVHEMLINLPKPITETPKFKPDAAYSIEVLKL